MLRFHTRSLQLHLLMFVLMLHRHWQLVHYCVLILLLLMLWMLLNLLHFQLG